MKVFGIRDNISHEKGSRNPLRRQRKCGDFNLPTIVGAFAADTVEIEGLEDDEVVITSSVSVAGDLGFHNL